MKTSSISLELTDVSFLKYEQLPIRYVFPTSALRPCSGVLFL